MPRSNCDWEDRNCPWEPPVWLGLGMDPMSEDPLTWRVLTWQSQNASLDLFFGDEVSVGTELFDNESSLFDAGSNERFWGAYLEYPVSAKLRSVDLYYLGYRSDFSFFNDVSGQETRHTYGLRSHGSFGRFSFNTELILQTGQMAGNDILALNVETDWKYLLSSSPSHPQLGLKVDWSSGDNEANDGKVNSFNPLFVNPGIYSLASVNTPVNLTSLHPSFSFYPAEDLKIYVDYALFYRTQKSDGFYSPPNFLTRSATGSSSKHLGNTVGLKISYELNRNISFDVLSSYFIPGEYIEDSGPSENIFFIAPTASFKF